MRCFVLLLLTINWSSSASAHEWTAPTGKTRDATWIMRDAKTSWCCGPEDCEPVDGRVYFSPEGWRVRGWNGAIPMDAARGLYKLPRGRGTPWACRDLAQNKLRCIWLHEAQD